MIQVIEKKNSEAGICDSCGNLIEPFEINYKRIDNGDHYCSDCMYCTDDWEVVGND